MNAAALPVAEFQSSESARVSHATERSARVNLLYCIWAVKLSVPDAGSMIVAIPHCVQIPPLPGFGRHSYLLAPLTQWIQVKKHQPQLPSTPFPAFHTCTE
jgi:hypothetical protein